LCPISLHELIGAARCPFAFSATKWIRTFCGVTGAALIVPNLGVVGFGFALFLVSSLSWGAVRLAQLDLFPGFTFVAPLLPLMYRSRANSRLNETQYSTSPFRSC